MRHRLTSSWRDVGRVLLGLSAVWMVVAAVPAAAQTAADRPVTFTKDIAPILQKSCQQCHRPDSVAPMSLITYEQVRPYARAIKQRTQLVYTPGMRGVMPPWFLERNIGVQQLKEDLRLSDAELATIAKWADSGAPEGNPADMPPPVVFADNSRWFLGKPDLLVSSPPVTVKATAADWWGNLDDTPTDLLEDRYAASIEYRETSDVLEAGVRLAKNTNENTYAGQGKTGIFVIHHNALSVRRPTTQKGEEDEAALQGNLSAFSLGRNGDNFPADAGKLIPAGAIFGWNVHLHAPGTGPDRKAVLNTGLKFHPKGYRPKFKEASILMGSTEIEIRPDSDSNRYDSYWVAPQPIMLMSYEPHMHASGIRMCMEAIVQRSTETLGCAGYDHNWVRRYQYDENAAPLLPKGTIIHLIGWFDGTSKNPNNIEPRNTTAWGRRSAQNMFGALGNQIMELTDEQYQQELARRRAYLDLTQGWDTVVGCPGCYETPAPSPTPARAAAGR